MSPTSGDVSGHFTHKDAILVTGGSGFVGRQLVRKLAESGKTVVSMYHHRLPEPMANVYPVCSDLGSSELLGAPLRGISTVIHLAWEKNFIGSAPEIEMDPSLRRLPRNVQLTQNLLNAMEKVGTKRIVFLSANGACRTARAPFLKEKYFAEFAILNSRIAEKVIIRPGIICGGGGSHDRFLRSIMNVMKFPGIYPVPSFTNALAPLHIEDVTELLTSLTEIDLDHKSAILEIVGNESFRIDELFRMVSDRFTKGAKLQLKGMLGNTLLPLFERPSKQDPHMPRLRHYLSLGHTVNQSTRQDNPLVAALPAKCHSFKEVLAENQSV